MSGGLDFLHAHRGKAHRRAGPRLREQRQVVRDDGGDLGIAAGGLVIRHQHDGQTVARHLHGAKDDAIGHDVRPRQGSERFPLQADAHAVAIGRNGKRLGEEGGQAFGREHFRLRARHRAHGD